MNVAEIEIKKKSNGKIQYLTEVLKEIPPAACGVAMAAMVSMGSHILSEYLM